MRKLFGMIAILTLVLVGFNVQNVGASSYISPLNSEYSYEEDKIDFIWSFEFNGSYTFYSYGDDTVPSNQGMTDFGLAISSSENENYSWRNNNIIMIENLETGEVLQYDDLVFAWGGSGPEIHFDFDDTYWSTFDYTENRGGEFLGTLSKDSFDSLALSDDTQSWGATDDYRVTFYPSDTSFIHLSLIESLFLTLNSIVLGFVALMIAVFADTGIIAVFYSDTTGLTVLGSLLLIAFGYGLVRWAFGYVRRLLSLRG